MNYRSTPTSEISFSGLLHAGIHGTFMRVPAVPARAESLIDKAVNTGILGFPWDAMCISRTGTNYGPRAIREASDQFSFYNASSGIDLNEFYTFADCGDVPVVPGAAAVTMGRAEAMLTEILNADAMPVTLGGDHSVTIACVRAFRKKYKNPGLILVDMHFDTALDVGGEQLSHCCPISRAVDAGFDPAKIAIVGTGGWMNPKSELDYIKDKGISLFSIEQIWSEGPAAVGKKAASIASSGTDSVYLTYDIDSIDAAYAPGTGVPSPGGLTSREAIELIAEISRAQIGGFDLVEVSPPYDHDGITTRLAVRLILEVLAGRADQIVRVGDRNRRL